MNKNPINKNSSAKYKVYETLTLVLVSFKSYTLQDFGNWQPTVNTSFKRFGQNTHFYTFLKF